MGTLYEMSSDELVSLVEKLRSLGVYHFKVGEAEVHMQPPMDADWGPRTLLNPDSEEPEKEEEPSDEALLLYSA